VIFRRFLMALMAAAAFSASAAVAVFALAFALYAVAEPSLGRAGGAAVVALVTTSIMGLTGFGLVLAARGMRKKAAAIPGALLEKVISFVQQKPFVAASTAAAAGFMAVRNPKYLGEVLRAFIEGKSTKS
jgi:hypothetical protein